MGLGKKAMMMKVGPVLFLIAFTATMEAHFDPNTIPVQTTTDNGEGNNYLINSTTTACCNNCPCTKSIPPQCHCSDVGETCHSACEVCACTISIPPQCLCLDTTNFCYDHCS